MEGRTQVVGRSGLSENIAHLNELHGRLLVWLRRDALPLWEKHGVDRERGGYFETIAFDPAGRKFDARGETRRGRVVARQMYVFDAGRRLQWQASGPDPVRHGCEYLFSRMMREDGLFHTAFDAGSEAGDGGFSLYESAFYLFALAKINGTLAQEYPVYETAATALDLLRRGWGKADGGFEESRPAILPLKSNPHMHLLEAALAWIDATDATPARQECWLGLAREIVDLALRRLIDPSTGALREFFDASWSPMADPSGRIVEPGHQFEWAWLLRQWAASRHCSPDRRRECRRAATRLVQVGEGFGVDARRGVAINEIWDDMTPKDACARLWPQTERVKAWCAVLEDSSGAAEADLAGKGLHEAVLGMLRYLDFEPAGLWRETLLADGEFSGEPAKASSLYHIVGAIETLHRCMAMLEEGQPTPCR